MLENVPEQRPRALVGMDPLPDVAGTLVVYERVPALIEIPMTGRLKTKAEALLLQAFADEARDLRLTERDGTETVGWRVKTDPAPQIRSQGRGLGRLPLRLQAMEDAVNHDLALTATGAPAIVMGKDRYPLVITIAGMKEWAEYHGQTFEEVLRDGWNAADLSEADLRVLLKIALVGGERRRVLFDGDETREITDELVGSVLEMCPPARAGPVAHQRLERTPGEGAGPSADGGVFPTWGMTLRLAQHFGYRLPIWPGSSCAISSTSFPTRRRGHQMGPVDSDTAFTL